MTVAELIAALERANPDAQVVLQDEAGFFNPTEVWTDDMGDVRIA